MPDKSVSPDQWRFTGYHMTAVMVSFFGVIFAVNLTMAYLANSSWTGLVVKNSYVASQKFNDTIALQEALEAAGWAGALDVKDNSYMFLLTKSSEGLDGCRVSGIAQRPVHEGQDIELFFTPHSNGLYKAVQELPTGQWFLYMKTKCPGTEGVFSQRYRFIISDKK